jgi:hypothetical protein
MLSAGVDSWQGFSNLLSLSDLSNCERRKSASTKQQTAGSIVIRETYRNELPDDLYDFYGFCDLPFTHHRLPINKLTDQ